MTEPLKLYVCTDGEYSDYGISAIFTTREAAEEFGSSRIEEWTAYDRVPPQVPWYHIERQYLRDGGWSETHRRTRLAWPWEEAPIDGYRPPATYQRTGFWEAAVGTDEGAVEKVWKEQHAAEEAEAAGL